MSTSVSSTSAAPYAPPAPASAPEGIAVFKDKDRSCAACKNPMRGFFAIGASGPVIATETVKRLIGPPEKKRIRSDTRRSAFL